MPHAPLEFFRRSLFVLIALLASASSSTAAATEPVTLAWHAPQPGHSLAAAESISRLIHFSANAILLSFIASRGYPMTILEDRSQTIAPQAGTACVVVKEDDARRFGGDHPQDTTVKKRSAQKAVLPDAAGRFGLLPPLTAEDPPRTPPASPSSQASLPCPAHDDPPVNAAAQFFSDPGDAALAEFPARPLAPGDSWTFSRPARVDRELASGIMTYTDRVDRIEERGAHRIAIIAVNGTGRMDVVKELQDKGFKTATLALSGTAEFDCSDGIPLEQHYTSRVEWGTRILGAHIGLIVDETYGAKPWTIHQP
ncbi:MAG TPA: hypothetical protein VKR99_04290 [Candidatus Eremiobacteraceae bacterium]|nr:hypothetical protein [Candidatus Eremiobacteraceae bacterium]